MKKRPPHYQTLDIPTDADHTTVKAAWQRAARATHPDHGGDAEQFQRAATAYAVLSDPHSRAEYDLQHLPHKRRRHRPKHRIKSYNLSPTESTGTDLAPVPWHQRHATYARPRPTPVSALTQLAACVLLYLTGATALLTIAAPTGLIAAAATLPATLICSFITVAITLSTNGHYTPQQPPRPTAAHLIAPSVSATAALLIIGVDHPGAWAAALTLAAATLIPFTARRAHYTTTIWKNVKEAARSYNTFAPPGPQPTVPTPVTTVFKEILTHVHGTKLFINLPAADRTIPYTLLTGRHLALLTTTDTQPQQHTPHTLHHAEHALQAAYPNITVTTHTLYQHHQPTGPHHTTLHDLDDRPCEQIGQLLTHHNHHIDNQLLYLLRRRLAHTPQPHPSHTP
ncbi:J domain-containing protein [Haloglycomyces albus]|uniref:J domain-containing protein n=1 Tax=Haloglycomyces albus TaxID=526067 RepID=UPI00046D2A76|nr:J domain-containing protein [Haloglycomyces albus]